MIGILKKWIEESYTTGYEAGVNAQKLESTKEAYDKGYTDGVTAQKLTDHEDQNRRLQEIYRYGVLMGRQEILETIEEIDLDAVMDDAKAMDEEVEEEVVA